MTLPSSKLTWRLSHWSEKSEPRKRLSLYFFFAHDTCPLLKKFNNIKGVIMLIIDKILNRTESFTADWHCKDQDQVNTILNVVGSLPYVKSYDHAIVTYPFYDHPTLYITITTWGHGRRDQIAKKIAEKNVYWWMIIKARVAHAALALYLQSRMKHAL